MKKDIEKPIIKGVTIAIKLDKSEAEDHWTVHLINENDHDLETVLVTSKGYDKEDQTSVLRHSYEGVSAHSTQQVEVITKEVFHLFNEYMVSYFVNGVLYDKKFTFVPETINSDNLRFIKALNAEGILHA
jgi:hypothetical protein